MDFDCFLKRSRERVLFEESFSFHTYKLFCDKFTIYIIIYLFNFKEVKRIYLLTKFQLLIDSAMSDDHGNEQRSALTLRFIRTTA